MLDKVMSLHSDIESPSPEDRLVIWEIDETTYRQWGWPVLTPRDKLTALLKQAVNGGASVIAVDIGLSWSGDGCVHGHHPPACPSANLTADKELGEYLKSGSDAMWVITRNLRGLEDLGGLGESDVLPIFNSHPHCITTLNRSKMVKPTRLIGWANVSLFTISPS